MANIKYRVIANTLSPEIGKYGVKTSRKYIKTQLSRGGYIWANLQTDNCQSGGNQVMAIIGRFSMIYDTVQEAAEVHNVHKTNISKYIKGSRKDLVVLRGNTSKFLNILSILR